MRLLLLFSLFTSTVFSQVIIHEKVEVKPKPPKQQTANVGFNAVAAVIPIFKPDTLNPVEIIGIPRRSVHVSVTGTIGPVDFSRLHPDAFVELRLGNRVLAHKDRNNSTVTPFDFGLTACTGDIPRFAFFDGINTGWTANIQDNNVQYDVTGLANIPNAGGTVAVQGTITLSVIPDPQFELTQIVVRPIIPVLTCGGSTPVFLTLLTGAGNIFEFCDTTTFPITVSVSSLLDVNLVVNGIRAKSFTLPSNAFNCQLEWDATQAPLTTNDTVAATITVGALGVTGTKDVKLWCGLDHFTLIADKSELPHGSSTRLTATAKNGLDQEISLNDTKPVKFTLSEPTPAITVKEQTQPLLNKTSSSGKLKVQAIPYLGSFIVGTDTIPTETTVTYAVAHAGGVSYLANGQVPFGSDFANVSVNVADTGDETKIGSAGVTVMPASEPPVIELVIERATLSPTLTSTPGANEGNSNVTRVLIKMTQSGQPAADQQIELKAEPILPSGGHEDHPEFPQNQRGFFSRNGNKGNPLVVTTNVQGEVDNLEYKTGEFSMLMKFTAQHQSSPANKEIQKQISVPPLKQLSSGSFDLKPIENPVQRKHPSPYWVVEGIDISLDLIATAYNALFPSGPRLTVTDANLQYGGRYEINGNWTHSRHNQHRRGLDVDLRSKTIIDDTYIDTNNNGKYDVGEPLSKDNNKNGKLDLNRTELKKNLKPLVPKFELEDPDGDNEHYHLYFWR